MGAFAGLTPFLTGAFNTAQTAAAAIGTGIAAGATALSGTAPGVAAHEAAHVAIGRTAWQSLSRLANTGLTALTAAQGIQALTAPRPSSGGAAPQLSNISSAFAARRFAASAGASPLGGTFNNVQGSPQLSGSKSLLGQ